LWARFFGKLLGQFVEFGLGRKIKGFCLGRFMPKPKFKQTMEVFEVTSPVSDLEAGLVSSMCIQCPTVARGNFYRSETTSATISGVDLRLSTSRGGCVSDPAVDSTKLSTSSRFVFPPLSTLKMLFLVSLDAPHKSEGISPAPVSSLFGFGSFGTSPFPKHLRWCFFDPSTQS
jgi:hypothetical protein